MTSSSFRDTFTRRPPSAEPIAVAPPARPTTFNPVKVQSEEDMHLSPGFLTELTLKALYVRGQATPADLLENLKVPFYGVLEEILRELTNQELCFITRGQSMNPLS